MRVKLMVGTATKEAGMEIIKKGSTRIKMNPQAIVVMARNMKKSSLISTVR